MAEPWSWVSERYVGLARCYIEKVEEAVEWAPSSDVRQQDMVLREIRYREVGGGVFEN